MRLKSYFGKDIKEALSQARQELGPEAMLVDSRRAAPEASHLGEFEVVVAAGASAAPPPETAGPATGVDRYGRLSLEVAEIRKQLGRMAAAVSRSSLLAANRSLPSAELAEVFAALVENELDPELAHDVLNHVRQAGGEMPLRRALAGELGARFEVDARLGCGSRPAITALVGPCGAGKTSTLVKLAVRYGLTARRPAQILSLDTGRVAACEQLRNYAAILGVGFQALETTAALGQALEEHRQKDLVLIDTPGYSLKSMEDAEDLARYVSSRGEIDTHLVLSASMKSADLSRVVDGFEIFRPCKLLFTRLDETEAFGPLVNEAVRSGKPVSFLTAGQQIPEDLEPATRERVVDLVLRRGAAAEPSRAAAAAAGRA